ncbi:DNA mismatch repair protein MutS [Candidatus Gracilibacteria bacterium]|nr:DNA mismatch repair protein MutS [Candidatus Gracilibacteria bacterium]
MQDIINIIDLIEKSIKEDGENLITGGNIIRDGYSEEIDKVRDRINNSREWLSNYQSKLINDTGIGTLRIKYTNITGYFIEISKNSTNKVPDYFVYKQTLVNASRYITEELKTFEKEIIQGEQILADLEYKAFLGVREKILDCFKDIKELSESTAKIDFITSLSRVAYMGNYKKPEITKDYNLDIKLGRHPIIEKITSDFISNDLELKKDDFVHIITGPNMGGKSTFLRQNALIILMSHIGSFVPANKAIIPITDKIFSRVGASDNLYLGQSTFMVEMQEMANILNNSTKKSFVIIDEIGRGTSTYDGMSLAWAILKENHDNIKAKTLFATHYHELVDESKTLKGVKNFSVAVGENEDNIVFLRKIVLGGMKKSYGLEVASLAGINKNIINEAKIMLRKLELSHNGSSKQLSLGIDKSCKEVEVVYMEKDSEVENMLKEIDVNSLTPIDALNKLSEIVQKVK